MFAGQTARTLPLSEKKNTYLSMCYGGSPLKDPAAAAWREPGMHPGSRTIANMLTPHLHSGDKNVTDRSITVGA